VNACAWQSEYYNIEERDHIAQYAPFVFDASILEIFPCLIQGASLYIIAEEIKMDPHLLNNYYEKMDITFSFLPTQFCELFMELENHSLRVLLAAGDMLRKFIKRNYRLYNNYGPTENTVVTTSMPVETQSQNIPIGTPIYNNYVYILDKNMQVQPIGVPGELCIGGDGLARGYLNRPELTAEKFIDFHHSRLYRTGDLARWLPDGNIEFLGRIDQQVKIRGFRIELGEIEMRLIGHHEIKEAVVICREHATGNKYLCAYIVRSDEIAVELSSAELREYLSQRLPEYMIPAYFIQVEKIPLTLNGKIDRKALPAPEIKSGKEYTAPKSEVEQKLVGIWSKVLGLEKDVVGIESHFFEMGGNSLNLIIMIGEIQKEFGIDMPFSQIIDNPRLKDMATFMTKSNLTEQPVVLLNWEREKKVFCFPEQNGFGYGYASLASLLIDYSFYTLSFIEDEDRINRYVDIITGIQPVGPYVFFGHSAAGKLTFVIAAALEKLGYEVSDIVFADSYLAENLVIEHTEEYMIEFRAGVGEFLKSMNAEFLFEKVFAKAEKYMEYWNTIVRLEKVNANVHLILSEEVQQGMELSIDPHCWDYLIPKPSRVYNGWGGHRNMLAGSYLAKNVKIIKGILDGIAFAKE
jgi:thioesterase domain-containing protein/acyl carrier protein